MGGVGCVAGEDGLMDRDARLKARRAHYVLRHVRVGRYGIDIVALHAWRLHRPQWFAGLPGFWYFQLGPIVVWWIDGDEARRAVTP